MSRSAKVDFPWSMCAMIEKLRICCIWLPCRALRPQARKWTDADPDTQKGVNPRDHPPASSDKPDDTNPGARSRSRSRRRPELSVLARVDNHESALIAAAHQQRGRFLKIELGHQFAELLGAGDLYV